MLQKRGFLYIAILSALALGVALISQHSFALRPCAWCVFQRLLLIALFGFSMIGHLGMRYKITALRLIARMAVIATAWGGIMAAWYQHSVAAKLFSCDMTFADEVMIKSGLESALPWLFGIYATCMEASADVLGVPYAIWALLFFMLVALISVLPLVNLRSQP